MNEKEYQKYKEETDRFVDDSVDTHVQADIARQLTRIADAQKQIANPVDKDSVMRRVPAKDTEFIELPDDKGNIHHFHRHDLKSYRDGYFSYKPQGGFKTILSAKDMEDIMGIATPPSPDALVEAVMDIDWDGEIEQVPKRMDGGYVDDSHEKSVYHFGLKDGLLEAKKIVKITLRPANHETVISKQPNILMDLLKDIEGYLQGKKNGQSFEESDLVGRIQSALAAHEKAVR